ncbi:MAG: ImmA/IrrE family metallo-endopeptidase [bacterium]
MKTSSFKAPFISIDEIWVKADKFREEFWDKDCPVDIFAIVEFDLDLSILPISGLKTDVDADALLLGDLKTIAVDNEEYLRESYQNRLRFSFAHEIGHLVLHKNIFSKIKYSSLEEYIQYFSGLPEDQYSWIEYHANEFAGRLLVPKEKLIKSLNRTIKKAEIKGFNEWDSSGESALEYVSHNIAKDFGVSEQVIKIRLIKEKLWLPK